MCSKASTSPAWALPEARVDRRIEKESLSVRTRMIGSLEVSTAGLGCANFGMFIDESTTRAVVDAALDVGVRHFDTADVYGDGASEEFLGRALGARRADVVITTKFGAIAPPDGNRPASAGYVKRACDASLARLGTDWIDLYLVHHPDPDTPIAETLGALAELQSTGKVREIGCSNFTPEQVGKAAIAAAEIGIDGFRTVQNSYSLLDRTAENHLVPACSRLGISILPYFPLAAGLLTGKYRHGAELPDGARLGMTLRGSQVRDFFPALMIEECFDIVEALKTYAEDRGHTLLELALGWLASKPYVGGLIAGATSPDQVRANVEAVSSWSLTASEVADVEGLTRVDVAFTWHAGGPSYSRPPDYVDPASAADVRAQP
jgi:aryl-alcohol dehydrogenase-like predicted oxidoreductase